MPLASINSIAFYKPIDFRFLSLNYDSVLDIKGVLLVLCESSFCYKRAVIEGSYVF